MLDDLDWFDYTIDFVTEVCPARQRTSSGCLAILIVPGANRTARSARCGQYCESLAGNNLRQVWLRTTPGSMQMPRISFPPSMITNVMRVAGIV